MAGVLEAVVAELEQLGVSGWRAAAARTLAAELDSEPNASMARELRSLMVDLGSKGGAGEVKGDLGDDLASRRAARIAAATGS